MRFSGVLSLNYLNAAEIMYIMKNYATAYHYEFNLCLDNAFNQNFKKADLQRGVTDDII